VDDSGRVAVADESAGRAWLFDDRGRTLALLSGLSRPASLAFAPDGTLLIASRRAGRCGGSPSSASPGCRGETERVDARSMSRRFFAWSAGRSPRASSCCSRPAPPAPRRPARHAPGR
jgi:sugar lactone lactonase YvrE